MLKEKIYYSLPYNARRTLFSKLNKKKFDHIQYKRTIETSDGYSFKPFDDYKSIFVHIPKAAGVSICTSLFGNLCGGHNTMEEYQKLFSKAEFDSYFKFTFVRNPWDRVFSAYNFLKKGGMNESDTKWGQENLKDYHTFEEFVKGWLTKDNIRSYIHFLPQVDFLCIPFDNKILVDFVGYFENINEDFLIIKNKIRPESTTFLSHKNNTSVKKKKYTDFYTEEMKEIVAELYRSDIELLGYNFDNSSLPAQIARRATV